MKSAKSKTGYYGVYLSHIKSKPYRAMTRNPGTKEMIWLGDWKTAEQAAKRVDNVCKSLEKTPFTQTPRVKCGKGYHVLIGNNVKIYKLKNGGTRRRCEVCRKDYAREWHQKQKEKRRTNANTSRPNGSSDRDTQVAA